MKSFCQIMKTVFNRYICLNHFLMVDTIVPARYLNCFKFEYPPLIKDSNLLYIDRIYSRNKVHDLS